MDSDEGQRRRLIPPPPQENIPDDEQTEPWGVPENGAPEHITRRMRLYREFLHRGRRDDNQ